MYQRQHRMPQENLQSESSVGQFRQVGNGKPRRGCPPSGPGPGLDQKDYWIVKLLSRLPFGPEAGVPGGPELW
jgi:hypothetical protein